MITSAKNPLVKRILGLKERKNRCLEQAFTIEGEKEIIHAVAHGVVLESLIFCPELLSTNENITSPDALEKFLRPMGEVIVTAVSARVFARLAYRDNTGGLLAIAPIHYLDIGHLILPENPFILVVEGVEKPGNLGALLRTADAAGVDAVFVCDPSLDLYNPNVVRAALGALFTVKTFLLSPDDAIAWLHAQNIEVVISSPAASIDYTEPDYTQPTAVVLGSEKKGLSALWFQPPFTPVKIPMAGSMDSLNLSAAGAVLMYEVARRRR